MKSRQLKPGDRFLVNPPDPEWPERICLTNDQENGIKWGWPERPGDYWCWMGEDVEVVLLPAREEMAP